MSRTILLDAGPLGALTQPKRTEHAIAAARWAFVLTDAGHRLVVPAIADFEVRRELTRAGKTAGLARLDAFGDAEPDRYLPLSEQALRLAAALWAQARQRGTPTADPRELDCDVILAAQALSMGLSGAEIIIATTNPGHLSQFVTAESWQSIVP
ncbi:MAG: hypothetical protein HY321_11555 [Armatimonadetes bacterium]|nr:hypothetical protein [Armatimonadota bacterium]